MKKMLLMLISVVVCALLFTACGQTDVSELDSSITAPVGLNNNNDQGEDEGNGKKPPVVVPPVVNLPEDVTVSVSIDYELNSWDGDILVRLTLSEGAWDNFVLWPNYGNMSNPAMVLEKAAILDWINLSFSSSGIDYYPVLTFVGGGYDYLDIRTSPLDNSKNRVSVNPKVLTLRFTHGYMHIALVIPETQIAQNFSNHLPITVTLNEEKLDEMKAKTDIAGNLIIGSKSAVIHTLNQVENQIEIVKSDIKYLRSLDFNRAYISDVLPPRHIFKNKAEWEDYINPMMESRFEYTYFGDGSSRFRLAAAVDAYDEVFFQDYNLVMVLFSEPSGGNRHEVETVDVKNNALHIVIKRDARGMTADMASWHIFIPIKKNNFNGDSVNVEVVNTPFFHPSDYMYIGF